MSRAATVFKNAFNVSFAAVRVNIPVSFNWASFIKDRTNIYNALSIKKAEVQATCDLNTFLHVSALALQAKIDANSVYGMESKAPVPERPPAMAFPFGLDRHLADMLDLVNQGELPSHGVTWTMSRVPKYNVSRMTDQQRADHAIAISEGREFPWFTNSQAVTANRQRREAISVARQLNRLSFARNTNETNLLRRAANVQVLTPLQDYQRKLRELKAYEDYLRDQAKYDEELDTRNRMLTDMIRQLFIRMGIQEPTPQQIRDAEELSQAQLANIYPAPRPPTVIMQPNQTRQQLMEQLIREIADGHTSLEGTDPIHDNQGYGETNLGSNLYWDPRMLADYDSLMNQFASFVGKVEFNNNMTKRMTTTVPLPLMGIHNGMERDSVYVSSPVVFEDPIALGTLLLHQPYVYNSSVDNLQVFKSAEIRGITSFRNGIREVYTSVTDTPAVNKRVQAETAPPPQTLRRPDQGTDQAVQDQSQPSGKAKKKKGKKSRPVKTEEKSNGSFTSK